MKKASLDQINKQLFFKVDAFLDVEGYGECKLVAIHGVDRSTIDKYEGETLDHILVSLRPYPIVEGASPQVQILLHESTVFEVNPAV